jgi:hypothetical protein
LEKVPWDAEKNVHLCRRWMKYSVDIS